MVNYRRNYISGGTYFFTVTLKNRNSQLLIDKFHLLQQAVATIKEQYFFKIKAYVVLPEHLHMIWNLPAGDDNYSLRWKLIKTLFSKAVAQEGVVIAKSKHREYLLWQRRFWEHTIRIVSNLGKSYQHK